MVQKQVGHILSLKKKEYFYSQILTIKFVINYFLFFFYKWCFPLTTMVFSIVILPHSGEKYIMEGVQDLGNNK